MCAGHCSEYSAPNHDPTCRALFLPYFTDGGNEEPQSPKVKHCEMRVLNWFSQFMSSPLLWDLGRRASALLHLQKWTHHPPTPAPQTSLPSATHADWNRNWTGLIFDLSSFLKCPGGAGRASETRAGLGLSVLPPCSKLGLCPLGRISLDKLIRLLSPSLCLRGLPQ